MLGVALKELMDGRGGLFAMPLRKEPWPPGNHEYRACPVCGEGWRPWAGSRLQCHSRCLMSEAGADLVLELWSTHGSVKAIGNDSTVNRRG